MVNANTIEGVRGRVGVHQHCGEAYLHHYLAEFDFRYDRRVGLSVNDVARAGAILDGVVGKRTYKTSGEAP